MVVSGNDPLESFLKSIQVVKNPLESNFRKVVNNLEHCFNGVVKNGNLNGLADDTNVEQLVAQLNGKKSGQHVVISGDDREKGKVPIKIFLGILTEKCGSNDRINFSFSRDGVEKVKVNMSKRGLKERYGSDNAANGDGNSYGNCLYFEVALSFLINGFVKAFPSPLKAEKNGLSHFPKFDVGVQDHECKNTDYEASIPPVNQFDHFKALKSVLGGKRFFQELDRDGDGQITLEDLEIAMRKRKLPKRYAQEFMQHTRSYLFLKSFGWKQFLSLMEQKEPTILRAYTCLCLRKSGTLQKSEILASLENSGLPVNEDNAVAMMRFLNADTEECIFYRHFRNFMLLLPSDRLQEDPWSLSTIDQQSIRSEAAADVAVPPPVEIPAGSVLKSALAGGLSCALSTALMHPVDTVKLPQLGVRALYRGSIPAILGQFSSHGLRTGICEASKFVLVNVALTLPDIQVQSVASFCGTFLGTAMRILCGVLKQRLQAGLSDNVREAIVGKQRAACAEMVCDP
ncbi:hypothetical protein Pfo_027085 [Paulownia fortunei]|nr:hypothetical protein Pfo_027085 [Paulownia fortunei]